MKNIFSAFLAGAMSCMLAYGQVRAIEVDDMKRYAYGRSYSLSGATAALALKLPASTSSTPRLYVEGITVSSSAAAVFTVTIGGTLSGGSADTGITKLNTTVAATSAITYGGTVSGGTTFVYRFPNGTDPRTIEFEGLMFPNSNIETKTIHIGSDNITSTVVYNIKWGEK